MKHIKLFEDLPSMFDPQYSNPVFKIRYRSNNDLSNKKAPDGIDKPVNDVLDGIEVGDAITGRGVIDDKEHTGNVVRVQKDEKGENSKIEIEEEGEVIELSAGSVKFAERGDRGHRAGIKGEPTDTGNIDYTFGGYDNFAPQTGVGENLKNIKSFNSFLSEGLNDDVYDAFYDIGQDDEEFKPIWNKMIKKYSKDQIKQALFHLTNSAFPSNDESKEGAMKIRKKAEKLFK